MIKNENYVKDDKTIMIERNLNDLDKEIQEFDELVHDFKVVRRLLLGHELPTGTWFEMDCLNGRLLARRQRLIDKFCSMMKEMEVVQNG